MNGARSRRVVPDLATAVQGALVALCSAGFGFVGHAVAMGDDYALPNAHTVLAALLASAACGVVCAGLARTHRESVVLGGGLLGGQFAVHLVLVAGHLAGAGGHQHGRVVVSASTGSLGPGMTALWSPGMALAHLAAAAAALLAILAVGRLLGWVAARATVAPAPLPPSRDRLLVAAGAAQRVPGVAGLPAGGTRGPPARR